MPKNVPDELRDKFDSCLEKVVADGQSEDAAYGICYVSVVEGKSLDVAIKEWGALQFDMPDELMINFGGEVKSLKGSSEPDYAIVYDGQDLVGDYFTRDTEFGFAGAEVKRVPILFNHAQPLEFEGKRYVERQPIGEAELQITDDGLLIRDAILYNREKYEKHLASLGWSTGAASHAVVREAGADGRSHIKQWLLSELSITPMSAEPRVKNVIAIKSSEAGKSPDSAELSNMENNNMENEISKIREEFADIAKKAASEAVAEFVKSLPEIKTGVNVAVTKDAADELFGSLGEQMQAVKAFESSKGHIHDPRLKRLDGTKAPLGANEGIPSQGQFLLEPTIARELLMPIHKQGVFTSKVRRLPVGTNSNYGWINGVNETSRANGSRWGGVQGYWRAEAASVTATKPKFRRVNWELHAVEVLMYVTEELMADAGMISGIFQQSAAEELTFKVNDAILNGDGAGKPLGVLNSPALVPATRTDANKILHADILNMMSRLHPSYRANAAWYVNSDAEPQLNALYFSTGSEGLLSPYIMYRADGVMTIMGKPVYVTEFNKSLGTAGDILLGDFGQYLLWDKGGVQTSVNPWIQWLTSEEAFKFTMRVDGQPAHQSAITPLNGSSTQSAFVALTASS